MSSSVHSTIANASLVPSYTSKVSHLQMYKSINNLLFAISKNKQQVGSYMWYFINGISCQRIFDTKGSTPIVAFNCMT